MLWPAGVARGPVSHVGLLGPEGLSPVLAVANLCRHGSHAHGEMGAQMPTVEITLPLQQQQKQYEMVFTSYLEMCTCDSYRLHAACNSCN